MLCSLLAIAALLITDVKSVRMSHQIDGEKASIHKKPLLKDIPEEINTSKKLLKKVKLDDFDEKFNFYPRSSKNDAMNGKHSREQLAKKAYGEEGETWKVSGYSKDGYPIIDLSQLGIDSNPTITKPKGNQQNVYTKKPLSYSEMKGEHLKKKTSSRPEKNNHRDYESQKGLKKYENGVKVAHKLHMELHRTMRYETVRSILYPKLKPPKYRITDDKNKLGRLFLSRRNRISRGKYKIQYLDAEKLMDIVIPDAMILVYKYFQDIPSLPFIYECKLGLAQIMWKVLGGFKHLDNIYGRSTSLRSSYRTRGFIRWVFGFLLRLVLAIKQSPPVTAIEPARQLEGQIETLATYLSYYTDKECEGDMDQRDWEQFEFNYKYMLDTIKLGEKRDRNTKTTRRKYIKTAFS